MEAELLALKGLRSQPATDEIFRLAKDIRRGADFCGGVADPIALVISAERNLEVCHCVKSEFEIVALDLLIVVASRTAISNVQETFQVFFSLGHSLRAVGKS